jgi:hypothetical protein
MPPCAFVSLAANALNNSARATAAKPNLKYFFIIVNNSSITLVYAFVAGLSLDSGFKIQDSRFRIQD